jgi:hypothetical protein
METMIAAGRRSLPPVPRPVTASGEPPLGEQVDNGSADNGSDDTTPVRLAAPAETEATDEGQEFVARLRGAAADFAAAAGAQTAVVREAVPPARHRRSRCRVVLRFADSGEVDLSFLGPAGSARRAAGFGAAVQRWLEHGSPRDPAWLVPDADAADGFAVDVAAWAAAG